MIKSHNKYVFGQLVLGIYMKISVEVVINAPLDLVWSSWVTSEDIKNWNFATCDWICSSAQIDLVVGGGFNYRMETKDGSMGFDFEGEFVSIVPFESIRYKVEDNRDVVVVFSEVESGIKVAETFETENENSGEQQRQGWLMILENFKKYVENKNT